MSDTEKSSFEKIRYRVEKISSDLETMTLDEHITVQNILTQLLQFRVTDEQKRAQREADDLKKKLDREAKFGVAPTGPRQ